MKKTTGRFESFLLGVLERIPPNFVIPVSIAVTLIVGVAIPVILHLDRVLSSFYVAAGSVLGMLPVLAVINKHHLLNSRRELLIRNGSIAGISNLDFTDFEQIVGALYESRGYAVKVLGGPGDGGIDVRATMGSENLAIQCKHWKKWQVGPREVRELRGAIASPKITPVLITSGDFSSTAEREASDKGIQLVDGKKFLQWVDAFIETQAPRCPNCGSTTIMKNGKRGLFWSCAKFPVCKGAVDLISD